MYKSDEMRSKFSNCRKKLEEGEEERMNIGFAGNSRQTTLTGTDKTHRETLVEERTEDTAQPIPKALVSGRMSLDFLRQLLQVCISKALLVILYLSIEQVSGRLRYIHQNSHWTPAEFVSQRIVWMFRGWKPTTVGNVRFNLKIGMKDNDRNGINEVNLLRFFPDIYKGFQKPFLKPLTLP